MQDIKRKFGSVLDLGSGPGHFSRLLDPEMTQKVVMLDSSGTSQLSPARACLDTIVRTAQRSSSTETLMMTLKVRLLIAQAFESS